MKYNELVVEIFFGLLLEIFSFVSRNLLSDFFLLLILARLLCVSKVVLLIVPFCGNFSPSAPFFLGIFLVGISRSFAALFSRD